MFRAIIVVFGRNKVRKGKSNRKYVGKDVSAGHPWVGRAGGRPLCILVVETLSFSYILCIACDSTDKKKKSNSTAVIKGQLCELSLCPVIKIFFSC